MGRRRPRGRRRDRAARGSVSVEVVIVTERSAVPLRRSAFVDLEALATPWEAAPVPAPQLVVLNESLAHDLGLDVAALREPDGVAALVGQRVPAVDHHRSPRRMPATSSAGSRRASATVGRCCSARSSTRGGRRRRRPPQGVGRDAVLAWR